MLTAADKSAVMCVKEKQQRLVTMKMMGNRLHGLAVDELVLSIILYAGSVSVDMVLLLESEADENKSGQ